MPIDKRPLKGDDGGVFFNLDVQERHSTLKSDPKSCLGYLRPKNEDAEKEKFKHYWEAYQAAENKAKAKVFNPRFQYQDA